LRGTISCESGIFSSWDYGASLGEASSSGKDHSKTNVRG
jgi:hypothetical protein